MDSVSISSDNRKRDRDTSVETLSDANRMPPPPSKGPRREFKDRNEVFCADLEAEALLLHLRHGTPAAEVGRAPVAQLDVAPSSPFTLKEVVDIIDEFLPDLASVSASKKDVLSQVLKLFMDQFKSNYHHWLDDLMRTEEQLIASEKLRSTFSSEWTELEKKKRTLLEKLNENASNLSDIELFFHQTRSTMMSMYKTLPSAASESDVNEMCSSLKSELEVSDGLYAKFRSELHSVLSCALEWNTNKMERMQVESKLRTEEHDRLEKHRSAFRTFVDEFQGLVSTACRTIVDVFNDLDDAMHFYVGETFSFRPFVWRESVAMRTQLKEYLESVRMPLVHLLNDPTLEPLVEEESVYERRMTDLSSEVLTKKREVERYTTKVAVLSKDHESCIAERTKLEARIQENERHPSEDTKELQMDHELLSLDISTKFMIYARADARLARLKDEHEKLTERYLEAKANCTRCQIRSRLESNQRLGQKAEEAILAVMSYTFT